MKANRIFFALVLAVSLSAVPTTKAEAAIPIAKIIKEAVKKVIKAVDLMIQRLQNKTIWLQNAQKTLENALNELKLKEIAEWTDKHRRLYQEYYDELWKVKNMIATYQRIRQIIERQATIVDEYSRVWSTIRTDGHFTAAERDYMYSIYTGILNESIRNIDQVMLVINSFETQMSDAERLEIIDNCGEAIDRNYYHLKDFNLENIQLSISRAKGKHEVEVMKKLYGL